MAGGLHIMAGKPEVPAFGVNRRSKRSSAIIKELFTFYLTFPLEYVSIK